MVWKGQRFGLAAVAGLVLLLLLAGVTVFQPQIHQPPPVPGTGKTVQLSCVRDPSLCGTAAPKLAVGTPEPTRERPQQPPQPPTFRISAATDLPPDPWEPPGPPAWFAQRRKRCPGRFLTVNTHTWGRHHNQLQSTILALLAAQLLNRTFILGSFRHNHQWTDVREIYSFAELQKAFCVIDLPTAVRLLRHEKQVECFGQVIHDMPIGKQLKTKCRNGFGPVDRFFDQHKFKEVVADALPHLIASTARIINLSGQLAFFMRPGLRLMSQGFGLLRPAPEVSEELRRFTGAAFGDQTDYLGIHLRYREGQCMNEVQSDFQKVFNISSDLMAKMEEQCTINYRYADRVFRETLGASVMDARPDPNRFCCPTFFASDHQNKTAEKDFLNRGATPYKGRYHTFELGGLKGLSSDYFMLRDSYAFIGNSASSVSQDVCFARLMTRPWRRACSGWHDGFFRNFANTALAELVPPEARG
eukprot:TRINITY_DN9373_c1_g1_i1.p1 TRINITY_DN9373_c1_g1~~TRINITY_DN9373_c1_g1_i1.p1  ORF type:complete len:472 (+),score=130.56 TRINITY_DN9373_c1_g1_i1:168-1583(+)